MDTVVTVVGGGLSGLALACGLRDRGAAVRVVEAAPRAGGWVRTETVTTDAGDWLIELGPNSFGDASTGFIDLARSLGLADALVGAPDWTDRRYLVRDGRAVEVPSKPPRFLLSPVLPIRGRLRLMCEPFIAPRPADAPEESLAEFCDRRLGVLARKKLLTPVVGGIYAGDPERLGAESSFPRMIALEREHGSLIKAARKGSGPPSRGRLSSFHEGLEALPRAMAAHLGDALLVGDAATAVERGEGWTVRTASGAATRSDHLVLATPAFVTAPLVRPFARSIANEMDAIHYAPIAVVHVGVRSADLAALPPGFGFLAPRDEGVRMLGTIFSSSLFPGRAPEGHELLTVFTGGDLDPAAPTLPEEEIRAYVLADLAMVLGLSGDPALFRVTRIERAIPQYEVGHKDRLARIAAATAELPGLHLLGNWKGGIAMPECVREAGELADRISAAPA